MQVKLEVWFTSLREGGGPQRKPRSELASFGISAVAVVGERATNNFRMHPLSQKREQMPQAARVMGKHDRDSGDAKTQSRFAM